jgi:hypothetical protein
MDELDNGGWARGGLQKKGTVKKNVLYKKRELN